VALAARSRSSGEAELTLRVIRGDGRVEDLGSVAYYHRNPLRRLWWRLNYLIRVLARSL
jgi:hypothetical protein